MQKDFYRNIETIGRMTQKKKLEVFEDFIQALFNFMTDPSIQVRNRQLPVDYRVSLRRKLTDYVRFPKAGELMGANVNLYLNAVKDSAPFTDVLGSSYDEHLGNDFGQFLTPPDVALLVAELNFAANEEHYKELVASGQDILCCDDMGCGSGSLLLAQLATFNNKLGKSAMRHIWIEAQDIDEHMAKLCSVQLYFQQLCHRIPIGGFGVTHGNTLTHYQGPFVVACAFRERVPSLVDMLFGNRQGVGAQPT